MCRSLLRVGLPLLVACLLGSTDVSSGDKARLQGAWRVVAWKDDGEYLHDAGQELDDDEYLKVLDFRWTFDGSRIVKTGNFQGFNEPSTRDVIFTYVIDPEANPKAIDIHTSQGTFEWVTRGIYEFRGKRLRVCTSNDETSKRRPKSFRADRGSGDFLLEFERVKK
jgi:uncharacterized protein (TIGR03067 family)